MQRGRAAGVGMPLVNSRKPPRQEAMGLPQQEAGGPPFCGSDSASSQLHPPLCWWQGSGEPSHCSLRGLVFSSCIKTCAWLGCKFYFLSGWRVSDSRVCWLPAQSGCQGLIAERRNFKRRMLSESWSASGSTASCCILLQSDGPRGWWGVLGGTRLCFPQVQCHWNPKPQALKQRGTILRGTHFL